MYDLKRWFDRVVQYPYRYKETTNSDGTIEHVPSPGDVLADGTPQSGTNFNHMEDGIMDAHLAKSIFLQFWIHRNEEIEEHLTEHDEEFSAETGEVTLKNTNTVSFAFNNSGTTVALKKVRKTMNYDLDYEITSVSGGQCARVVIYDKQLNGFKLKFEGSAKSVTLKYKVRGGMYA